MKKIILLILTICLFSQQFYASYGLYNMEKLNNMLSNNAILSMHQDAYGFMWFGTYDGLNLYDGSKVTTFRYEQNNPFSLSGNNIHAILSVGSDYLWVGTQVGLDKFSIKERKVVESYPQYKKIQLIATDAETRTTWLIVKNNCLEYYDSIEKSFRKLFLRITKNDIKSFFVDKEGRLCIVKANGDLQSIVMKDTKGKNSKNISIQIRKIHEKGIGQVFYEDGNIYFIDNDLDLFFYDHIKQHKILLRNISDLVRKYNYITSLVVFHNDIFLAFMYGGLIKLNMSNLDLPEPINTTIGIFGLQKDQFQNAIWVGTDGRGVELYYSEKDKFSNILCTDLPFTARRPVRAFYTDENNTLWVGTKGDGIIRIKDYEKFSNTKIPAKNVQQIKVHNGFYETPVYAFIRSRYNNRNDLWMTSDEGLLYYSYKEDKVYKIGGREPDQVGGMHTLCEINDSVLWIPMGGIYRVVIDKTKRPYQIKSKKQIKIKKNGVVLDDEYYSIAYDGATKLFFGSRRGYGVLRIDVNTLKYDFVSIANAQNKGIGDIISLFLDKDSTLYVGTGSGMTLIKMFKNKENEVKQFGRHNGIINDMIHGILKDNNGIIWLSTNKGLVKYNPQNQSFFNVKSSQIRISEYSDDAYWLCPITHRLFFGGVNGLMWIESKKNDDNISYKPKLMFTEINYFDKMMTLYDYNKDPSKVLVLNNNQNTFQISFAVLDFIHSENYDFSYKLDNYDKEWNSLQKDLKIHFTQLPYGNYTLKVKYKSDVLYTDDNVYELRIKVLPPWYLSVWARVVYIILLITIGTILYIYLQKKARRKQANLAIKIKEEQKEKMYESKLRFFTNITHEFYTPLTLINGAVEQIKKQSNGEHINKYVNILQNNTLSLNELIQEILDYRKVEESDSIPLTFNYILLNELLQSLLNSVEDLVKQNKIILTIEIEDDLYWWTDLACFKKIISNLLSNALKYTPVGEEVNITFKRENNQLNIVVYNTGRGIEASKINRLFSRYSILEDTNVNANNQMTARHGLGLHICNSMTKLLKGDIKIESEVDKFTRFIVTLPNMAPRNLEINETMRQEKEKFPETIKPQINNLNIETLDSAKDLVLIVDDNPDIVELVRDILSINYLVKGVYSAAEALVFLKVETPALIVTDIMMPEIDGLSFVKMVREDKYNKQIPIIALTAKVSERDQVEGYDTGVDAYLTKPFSSDVLLSIVNRFLINKENIKEYYDTVESSFEYTQGKLVHQNDKEFIETLIKMINENISNTKLGPELIAEKMKISSRSLYRQLKKILSISPSDFIKDYKLSYASRLLITTNLSIKEIIYKVGVSNKSYFYREFAKKYNMSPKQYKESYKNENDNIAGA
ncbi:MAG: response regulator [Paludibacter sp.]|nr:response regulator [Paludibacter sp.]